MDWDIFISHASEDKESIARPLAKGLQSRGLNVWFDEFTLTVGDSLRRSIDLGLAHSQFGIVIISHNFLNKEWPQKELDGLVAREIAGVKVILPIWHGVAADEVRHYSPMLADRLAASSSEGLEQVIARILEAVKKGSSLRSVKPVRALSDLKADHALPVAIQTVASIYCKYCGAVPGTASKCSSGYISHTFIKSDSTNVYCKYCGAMPGAASKCASGYISHTFIKLGSASLYCKYCGAVPGAASKCSSGYISHTFVEL